MTRTRGLALGLLVPLLLAAAAEKPRPSLLVIVAVDNAVPAGCSEAPSAPYDLAPTLADYAGVKLPHATGRSLRTEIERSAGRMCR
jgi:hypothetical protein